MSCPKLSLLQLFILEPIRDTCSGKLKLERRFWYCRSELSTVTHLGRIWTSFHTVKRAFGPTKRMEGQFLIISLYDMKLLHYLRQAFGFDK